MRDLGYSEGYVYDPNTEEGFSGPQLFSRRVAAPAILRAVRARLRARDQEATRLLGKAAPSEAEINPWRRPFSKACCPETERSSSISRIEVQRKPSGPGTRNQKRTYNDQTLFTSGGSIMRRSAKLAAIAALAALPFLGSIAAPAIAQVSRAAAPAGRSRTAAARCRTGWPLGLAARLLALEWPPGPLRLGRRAAMSMPPMHGQLGCRAIGFWSAAAGSGVEATGATDRRLALTPAHFARDGSAALAPLTLAHERRPNPHRGARGRRNPSRPLVQAAFPRPRPWPAREAVAHRPDPARRQARRGRAIASPPGSACASRRLPTPRRRPTRSRSAAPSAADTRLLRARALSRRRR